MGTGYGRTDPLSRGYHGFFTVSVEAWTTTGTAPTGLSTRVTVTLSLRLGSSGDPIGGGSAARTHFPQSGHSGTSLGGSVTPASSTYVVNGAPTPLGAVSRT